MEEINRFLFVGGCGRSGTTLLQAMLNAHKDIYGGPEFGYLPLLCQTNEKILSSINHLNKLDVYLDESELNIDFKKLISSLLSRPAIKQNASIVSEKSPHNILVFEKLSHIFPEGKFIFVIRDPRAIYASAKKIKENAKKNSGARSPSYSKNVTKAIEYINHNWKLGFEFAEKHPSKVLLVFYEDLVTEPEKITKEVCDFLQIEWDNNMMNHTSNMNKIINKNEKSIWGGSDLYHKKIHTDSLKKWGKTLSRSEKHLIRKNIIDFNLINEKYFNEEKAPKLIISHEIIQHVYRKWNYRIRNEVLFYLKKIRNYQ